MVNQRAPTSAPDPLDISFVEETNEFSSAHVSTLPATTARQREIQVAQDDDAMCAEVKKLCKQGWPAFMPQQPAWQPYWEKRGSFTVVDGILLMDSHFVIPPSLRLEMVNSIHDGHPGIMKCQARARE